MYAMDAASVMEAWDDIDAETESESSDVGVERDHVRYPCVHEKGAWPTTPRITPFQQ